MPSLSKQSESGRSEEGGGLVGEMGEKERDGKEKKECGREGESKKESREEKVEEEDSDSGVLR